MPTSSEPGAPPQAGMIPLCVPEMKGNEWKYVKDCLDTNWVSSAGPYVDRFEHLTAEYVGTEFAIATASGTAALHVALLVVGVEPEDEVLVSSLSFVAPANAIRYVGAWPVFMDATADSWQMDPEKTVDFLNLGCDWKNGELRNKKTGRRVRAILPVHILGHPVDIDPILDVARRFELAIVEDATESLGSRYKDEMVGNLGDIACLSYNGNKMITTGSGGMIVTNDPKLAARAKHLTTQAKTDPIEYDHDEIGYNYRLSNIHAAMGCAQMEVLDSHIAAKLRIAGRYAERLGQVEGIRVSSELEWAKNVYWLYTILIDSDTYGLDSRQLMKKLEELGVQTRPLWKPLNELPPYRTCQSYQVEVTPALYKTGLSLPCSVGLSQDDQERVIVAIERARR